MGDLERKNKKIGNIGGIPIVIGKSPKKETRVFYCEGNKLVETDKSLHECISDMIGSDFDLVFEEGKAKLKTKAKT